MPGLPVSRPSFLSSAMTLTCSHHCLPTSEDAVDCANSGNAKRRTMQSRRAWDTERVLSTAISILGPERGAAQRVESEFPHALIARQQIRGDGGKQRPINHQHDGCADLAS